MGDRVDPLRSGSIFNIVDPTPLQSPRPRVLSNFATPIALARPTAIVPAFTAPTSAINSRFEELYALSPVPRVLQKQAVPADTSAAEKSSIVVAKPAAAAPAIAAASPIAAIATSASEHAKLTPAVTVRTTAATASAPVATPAAPAPVTAPAATTTPAASTASTATAAPAAPAATAATAATVATVATAATAATAASVTLKPWCIIPGAGSVRVRGTNISGATPQANWVSTDIVTRVSSRLVATQSGRQYALQGRMLIATAVEKGIPESLAKKFRDGFPATWQSLIQEAFSKEEPQPEPPAAAPSSKPASVPSNKSAAASAAPARQSRAAAAATSAGSAKKRSTTPTAAAKAADATPRPRTASASSRRTKATKATTAAATTTPQSARTAAATPRSHSSAVVTPRPRTAAADNAPVTPTLTPLAEVADALPKSRSGRFIMPVLKWWEGEHVVREKKAGGVGAVAIAGDKRQLLKRIVKTPEATVKPSGPSRKKSSKSVAAASEREPTVAATTTATAETAAVSTNVTGRKRTADSEAATTTTTTTAAATKVSAAAGTAAPDVQRSPRAWTASELTKLRAAVLRCDSTDPLFWQRVASMMNTGRSADECSQQYQQSPNIKRVKKADSDAQEPLPAEAPSPLTGMEGAKNRKKIRALLQQADRGYSDDAFASPNKQAALPTASLPSELAASSVTPMKTGAGAAAVSATPVQRNTAAADSLMSPPDHGAADVVISRIKQQEKASRATAATGKSTLKRPVASHGATHAPVTGAGTIAAAAQPNKRHQAAIGSTLTRLERLRRRETQREHDAVDDDGQTDGDVYAFSDDELDHSADEL